MPQPSWLNLDEALRYFGLGDDLDKLEQIVVEYDIDADFDGEGNLIAVDGGPQAAVALFDEHEKIVGHRPDDPKAEAKARKVAEDTEKAKLKRRQTKRQGLIRKVAERAV